MRAVADRQRGRRFAGRGAPRLVLLLAGIMALGVAGFGLGLVVGILVEEPSLLFTHLTGGSSEVVLGEDPAEGEDPVEGRAPASSGPIGDGPGGGAGGTERGAAQASAAGQAEVPAVSAAPSAVAGLAVQVGAFAEPGSAERLAASLRASGLPVYVSPGDADSGARWRVRVGPLDSRPEAERLAERLQREQKLPTWILSEPGS